MFRRIVHFSSFLVVCISLLTGSFTGCCKQPEPVNALGPENTPQPVLNGWTVIGPGGGGAQFEPTISPHDPDHVFIRCDMTGAYVSKDAGENWRMFNLRTVVRDYEFDPNDANTVYAANAGLYRSEDRGKTWQLIRPKPENVTGEVMTGDHAGHRYVTSDDMPGGNISRMRVDPGDSRRLTIGLSSWRRGGGGRARVLTSSDRGETWTEAAQLEGGQVLGIFPGQWDGNAGAVIVVTNSACAQVKLDGSGAEELLLPVESVISVGGGKGPAGAILYILSGNGEIHRSRDMGRSWERADDQLVRDFPANEQAVPARFRNRSRYRGLAVCEGSPEVIYLSCNGAMVEMNGKLQRQSGVLKSTDAGAGWNWALAVSGGDVLTDNFKKGWLKRNLGWFGAPSYLGVCPTDPDVVYITDSGRTTRTLDGGKSWTQVVSRDFEDRSFATRGLDVTTTYGVHFDPYNPDHFFITYTDIGLFHTFNFGKSWYHSITGIPQQWRNTCYWLEFDPDVKGRIYSVWSNVHDLPRPKMHRSGNLTNGRQQGGAAVSGDGGRYWGLLNTGILENGVYIKRMRLSAVPTHIVIDTDSPVNSRTLYVCDYGWGVWKSTDGGRTWETKNQGLDPTNLNCWRITRLPSGKLILLVSRAGIEGQGQTPGAMYSSDDGAESWQPMAMPARVTMPNDLVLDLADSERMYLSCWPLNVQGKETGGGVYRTEDDGKSWRQVFDEKMHVYAAAVDPANPATVHINTFNSAAFCSDDRGETWKRLGGYNFKWGHRPVIDPVHPGMLFLTSFGGSVFYGSAKGYLDAVEDIINLPPQEWEKYW